MSRNYNGNENQDEKRYYHKDRYGDEQRDCDERREYDDDCCNKRKKRRCDDDWWDSDKCRRPCDDHKWENSYPDWLRCPPWFWFKPEHDGRKADDRKEDCNKRRDRGELEAFAYVFSQTATPTVVPANADVIFTNNGILRNVNHTTGTAQVLIRRSGAYQIFYSVRAIAGTGATVSLAVNGIVEPSTTITVLTAPSEASGKVILNLRAGQTLTLRNSSNIAITLVPAPEVGAQLTLERIGDIENENDYEND